MTFDEYQKRSQRTANPEKTPLSILTSCVGLAGEVGEVIDPIKKVVGHGHPVTSAFLANLVKEIGDAMWYLGDIATTYGISLDLAAHENIAKLESRYPNGFNTADSINRVV